MELKNLEAARGKKSIPGETQEKGLELCLYVRKLRGLAEAIWLGAGPWRRKARGLRKSFSWSRS